MNKIILYLLIIFLMLFQMGCFDLIRNDTYDYLKIENVPSNNNNYSVIIPIPMLNDNISILVRDLKWIIGDGNWEYNQTEKGIGLKIESNGRIKIEKIIKNSDKKKLYNRFSFPKWNNYYYQYTYEGEFYTYVSFNNSNNLNIELHCNSGLLHTYIWGDTHKFGWNELHGYQANITK